MRWRHRLAAAGHGLKAGFGAVLAAIGVFVITGLDKTEPRSRLRRNGSPISRRGFSRISMRERFGERTRLAPREVASN